VAVAEDLAKLFEDRLAAARNAGEVWAGLWRLADSLAGCRLFTVMTVDMKAGLARRAFTSHPDDYPVSGTKPIAFDHWFDIVARQHRPFVANTLADIAKVFPDHEKIGALGLGSVVNLPVLRDGELAATVNLLDRAHHYTAPRVAAIVAELTGPALRCWEKHAAFD
jgi:hypothetical protein